MWAWLVYWWLLCEGWGIAQDRACRTCMKPRVQHPELPKMCCMCICAFKIYWEIIYLLLYSPLLVCNSIHKSKILLPIKLEKKLECIILWFNTQICTSTTIHSRKVLLLWAGNLRVSRAAVRRGLVKSSPAVWHHPYSVWQGRPGSPALGMEGQEDPGS